jgi:hypothetical protein
MANLASILTDPNYVNANEATKQAIFDKFSAQDPNFTSANPATQGAIRQKFGVAMPAAPAMPELPESLRPRTAASEGMPGARQELSTGQRVYQAARPFVAPLLEAGGAIGGGLLGTPMGPAGIVGGAGLGYGIAKEGLELADVAMGMKAPRQGVAQVAEPVRNVLEGATFEAGGRVAGPLIAQGIGKLADLRQIPKNKAADIARNALGPDLPEVLNALKAGQGKGISAAQAAADINSPTFQALIDRATARDPRFLSALEKSQGDVSLNALSKLAGGKTAADVRATTEFGKENVRAITTPMRDASLARGNLGKEVARLESMSADLGEQAAAKVQEVRRLMELGDVAAAAARLETVKAGLPASSRFAPAKSQIGFSDEFASKFFYPGKLAQMSDEWASKAATASLDLGQGARFSQAAADALRKSGIQPLKGDALVNSIRGIGNNPEFAGNDLLLGSLRNVSDDVAKWTNSGGVIDLVALDAIRKNSVNAAIQQLRPGMDATSQRNAAAGVLSRIRPVIDDAIEASGGVGYREYLATHAKGMQKIAEKELTGEALRLFKNDKNAFVRLVQNESPEAVEKILGPGKYNIAVELAENTLAPLQNEAAKVIRNANIKSQVEGGQVALKELLLQNMSKFRLPSYLSAVAATTNKALNILETKIGTKTMATLTEALKTPEGAAQLLESLPAAERNRVLQIMADPAKWGAPTRAAVTGTTAAGVNMLAPERFVENEFAR